MEVLYLYKTWMTCARVKPQANLPEATIQVRQVLSGMCWRTLRNCTFLTPHVAFPQRQHWQLLLNIWYSCKALFSALISGGGSIFLPLFFLWFFFSSPEGGDCQSDGPCMPHSSAASCEKGGMFVCLAPPPDSTAHSFSAVVHCFLTLTNLSIWASPCPPPVATLAEPSHFPEHWQRHSGLNWSALGSGLKVQLHNPEGKKLPSSFNEKLTLTLNIPTWFL